MSICGSSLVAWVPTYISRKFGMEPISFGAALGLINLLAAGALVIKGVAVDWLFGRGMQDAHIRFYCWMIAITIPVAAAMFLIADVALFLMLYGVLQLVVVPYMVYASATISLIAPPILRGRLCAGLLFVFNIIDAGMGPMLVGALTDYVFRDEGKLSYSLLTLLCIGMPLSLA